MQIELNVNGQDHTVDAPPMRRLLDILREELRLTGTKEGCGEGECGACSVLLDGDLVNACLVPALQLHGRQVVTIEGLGTAANPDPVQSAFLEEGAIQCGFCIPGMVMASHALLDRNPHPSREQIRGGLAGNLCRCTGYERIVKAVEKAAGAKRTARPVSVASETASSLSLTSLSHALDLLRVKDNELTVIAGATDLLTNVKLGLVRPAALLDITRIEELNGISRTNGTIEIGSGTTFAAIAEDPLVVAHLPALAEAARQFAAPAIRNRATLGGNLMTASPAADAPPPLMALDATVVLASSAERREFPIASFFTDYRKTRCRDDELLLSVRVPIPAEGTVQAFYKVGTRRAQAISKISVACRAQLTTEGALSDVRIATGSVAPTPILLHDVRQTLEGTILRDGVAREAGRVASREVAPIDDVRSTESYRRVVVGKLVERFLLMVMKQEKGR